MLNFSDANYGNVLYHEHNGQLTSAHFVDWGLASPAAMGRNNQLDSRTQTHIVGFSFIVIFESADNVC